MNEKIKNIMISAVFILFIAVFSISAIVKEPGDISESERRPLQQFPEITYKDIMSGRTATDLEKYFLDQFPFRETFRAIKANARLKLFLQRDNNDVYIVDGCISKIEYPLSQASIKKAAQKFESIYEMYFKDTGSKVWCSIVPDKNYFMAEKDGYPAFDYDELEKLFLENIQNMEYIDIFDTLELGDYYLTDTHWRQECLGETVEKLASHMGFETGSGYETKEVYPFYGVYAGQSALNVEPDTLRYLTNSVLENCTVYSYDSGETRPVYDLEKETSLDKYDIFLSGAVPLIRIDNPNAKTDKELILFRDSFGSSIAPLMAGGYSSITIVDIRYTSSAGLGEYIEFNGQDVLFLYSTMVLNSSAMLK